MARSIQEQGQNAKMAKYSAICPYGNSTDEAHYAQILSHFVCDVERCQTKINKSKSSALQHNK